jgi:transcription elongation factor GreB
MSRGFVKENDQEEIPIVPPRADLPENVTNYVTQMGLNELLEEQKSLINKRDQVETDNESERRISLNHINAVLQLLNQRIATAKVVELKSQPKDEVRFGATMTLKIGDQANLQQYQIVGVDEADISKGKISFISPIARLLTNKKVGETAVLKLAQEDRAFEVMDISYVE